MDRHGALPDSDRLFERAACGLVVAEAGGLIRRVNATFCAWLGYPCDALVGQKRVQDLFTIGGRVFHQTHLAPLLQMQGSVAEVQLDMRHADGHVLPMLINIVRSRDGAQVLDELAVFIATDRRKYEHELVVARKNAEQSLQALRETQQALQESRDVLGVAMRGAKMGIWSRDIASGAVWLSSELEALAGLGEGRFGGTIDDLYALIHPDDRAGMRATVDEALALVRDCSVEFRLARSDGSWLPMAARVRLACDASGTPSTVFGVATDISDRVEAETIRRRDAARLHELNAELARADRKKDEFLATLAHELRNPLAPLRNVLEILKMTSLADPQLVWARDVFERQMDHMTHLVDDLMEVSRITQGRVELRKEELDLGAIMQAAVEACRTLIQEGGHHLTFEPPVTPVTVQADPTRLTQILTNLLNNAGKYTPQGGEIWFGSQAMDDHVAIVVRDSGIGIAEENLANVFTMFSQLEPAIERSQGGLGIGLALVKGLVELHGGDISVRSAGVGKGSEFKVRLPCLAAMPAPVQDSPDPAPAPPCAARRIMVVDDNHDGADMLRLALELLGHEVHCVYDGTSALRMGPRLLPDAIVLDIGLPDMDGYTLARNIRASGWGADATLVAATGWGQQSDKDKAMEAGFDAHLVKPIDFAALAALLER